MSRSTTEEIVLDTIYELAGIRAPTRKASAYPGYPLAKNPTGADLVFYLLWPVIVVVLWRATSYRVTTYRSN
jgi:hypothetical protein